MNEWRSFCEMQLKKINYWVRFWSWTWCFCFFRFFLFDRSVAARCSCVNLHFTPVSIQSACSKPREKQEKTYKNRKMAFPNPNYKEKVGRWLGTEKKLEGSDWFTTHPIIFRRSSINVINFFRGFMSYCHQNIYRNTVSLSLRTWFLRIFLDTFYFRWGWCDRSSRRCC